MTDIGPTPRPAILRAGLVTGLLLLLAVADPVAAQEATPSGTPSILGRAVTADGDPATGAVIQIRRADLEVRADGRGEFVFSGLEPGLYRVQASLPDHAVVVEDARVDSDGPAQVTLELIPLHRLMQELRVTTERPSGGDRNRGSRTVVRAEQLREGGAGDLLQALLGQVPGTRITTSGGDPGGEGRILIRGPTSITQGNDPLLFMDGVRMAGTNPARVLESMAPTSVDSLEVLRGPEASRFGPGSAAGVILIHTRRGTDGRTGDGGGGTDRS